MQIKITFQAAEYWNAEGLEDLARQIENGIHDDILLGKTNKIEYEGDCYKAVLERADTEIDFGDEYNYDEFEKEMRRD